MPYVKHICIHNTVNKSLAYILDPEKTDDMLLTISINCTTDARDAYLQMKAVYNTFAKDTFDTPKPKKGNGTVKAIHYVISFADEENVTPEQAHTIAKAFVRKAFGDEVQAVIATHVDADHIHNHIIVNSYLLNGDKLYANQRTLRRMREVTNGVCRAFGVRPALNFENKGRSMQYNEWQHKKNGTSWKEKIREEIDRLIGSVNSLNELLSKLQERGYEVKRGKYISVKAPRQERCVRTKTLGEEYTEESLNARILYKDIGAGNLLAKDDSSELRAAYISILDNVRILAEQRKKVQRKYNNDLPYSADNDLDVFRLSAQLSVISKERISSIGELEGRINMLKKDYEKTPWVEFRNKLLVYSDIRRTYYDISKGDYLSRLVEEEKQRREKEKNKKKKSR